MTGDDDTLREACGVFAIYAPGEPVAHLTYDGLYALQHRGQESAGMAVSDGTELMVVKEMGLVSQVFSEHTLAALPGCLAIGHTRYSTTGSSVWRHAQPVHRSVDRPEGAAQFALGHNGNLTNTAGLAADLGVLPGTMGSDSEVLAEMLVRAMAAGASLEAALMQVLPDLQGAFTLVLTDADRIFGVRDPNGFRPLCLGRLPKSSGTDDYGSANGAVTAAGHSSSTGGWVLASESPALDVIGATFVRDIEPGELVVISGDGPRSLWPFPESRIDPHLCVFEFVYFARPDAVLGGHEVHGARHRMGGALFHEAPLPDPLPGNEACLAMVMGVPDSGIPAAEGYALASGIPYGQGLVKNRYIGRTFIAPEQRQRDRGVRRKLNPLRENIAGKRLVVLDDSIVRGTTSRKIVSMLRDAGAAEVHLRITSPPYQWPCYYGMDTGDPNELIASRLTVPEIGEHIGADSLAYLSVESLLKAVRAPGGRGFCTACLTGEYPTEVPVGLHKRVLETIPSR